MSPWWNGFLWGALAVLVVVGGLSLWVLAAVRRWMQSVTDLLTDKRRKP